MTDPIVIKYSKCYIHKPYLNFVKDGPLNFSSKLSNYSTYCTNCLFTRLVYQPHIYAFGVPITYLYV